METMIHKPLVKMDLIMTQLLKIPETPKTILLPHEWNRKTNNFNTNPNNPTISQEWLSLNYPQYTIWYSQLDK